MDLHLDRCTAVIDIDDDLIDGKRHAETHAIVD
jgi:hypothetical protein